MTVFGHHQPPPTTTTTPGVNAPDHRGRMTSPERRYSMEHHLRAELLEFDPSKNTGKTNTGDNRSENRGDSKYDGPPVSLTHHHHVEQPVPPPPDEGEELFKWEQRVQREGFIGANGVMELFTPEQLVATSNDGKSNSVIMQLSDHATL
jgi:hypothetical protein